MPDNIGLTSIHAVKPVYSATFTFSDPVGDFRYTIDWIDTGVISTPPEYNAIPRGWIRLEAHATQPRALLDITLTSLSIGSSTTVGNADGAAAENLNAASSWRFGIDTSFTVPQSQVPSDLTNFVDRIRFDSLNAAEYPNHDFVVCADFPSLTSIRQCTSHSYRIAGSDYSLEVMQFQDRITNRAKHSIDAYEPRVSIAIRRPDWEAMFEENERLVVGQGTRWADDMETWFPCDSGPNASDRGDGFMQLMEKLQRVAKVVRSA
nr:hypothetical protein CFP56_00909 [Quercus suber]